MQLYIKIISQNNPSTLPSLAASLFMPLESQSLLAKYHCSFIAIVGSSPKSSQQIDSRHTVFCPAGQSESPSQRCRGSGQSSAPIYQTVSQSVNRYSTTVSQLQ